MLEELKQAYQSRLAMRILVYGCLLLCAVLLYALPGGFPPWAWRFLASLLPRLPELWSAQGTAILLPLSGLILFSLSLLILWITLLTVTLRLVFHGWRERYEQERFERELAEADLESESLARELMDEEYAAESAPHRRSVPLTPITYAYEEDEDEDEEEEYRPERVMVGSRTRASKREPVAATWDRRKVAQEEFPEPVRTMPQVIPARPVAAPQEMEVPAWPGVAYAPIPPGGAMPSLAQPNTSYGVQFAPTTDENERVKSAHGTPQGIHASTSVEEPRPIELASCQVGRDSAMASSAVRKAEGERRERVDWGYDERDDIAEYETRPVAVPEEEEQEEAENETSGELRLRLSVGMGLDPGLTRKDEPNEDNIFAMQGIRPGPEGPEPIGLFVVADGMGGHADGQEASRLAIQTINDVISPTLLREAELEESFGDIIKDAAHRANLALYRRNRQQEHMMGTTLTAALVVGTMAHIVNIGDSRTYRYRASEGLTQITRDHSVVARLVENGLIEPDEVYTHPKRNQIYRCLGEHASVELDYFKVELQERDILVLCSDGLWEMVRDEEIERIISEANYQATEISSMLVQAALSHGGKDNIGVIVSALINAEPAY